MGIFVRPHFYLMSLLILTVSCFFPQGKSSSFSNANLDDKNLSSLAYSGFQNIPDPLASSLWHIENKGQSISKQTRTGLFERKAIEGIDHQIKEVLDEKIYGEGIKVWVSDDGVDHTHIDLADNFTKGSVDFCDDQKTTPDPNGGSHGTSAAGLISSIYGNGHGGYGVAPLSKVAGDNFLSGKCRVSQVQSSSIPIREGFHIMNMSYGVPQISHMSSTGQFSEFRRALWKAMSENDTLIFKSSGNDRRFLPRNEDNEIEPGTQRVYGDSNRDNANTSPGVLLIAALDNQGVIASYSSPGSNLWGTGASGYGYNGTSEISGVCTTSIGNNYTCSFNGTSASAPIAAGIGALVRSANPNLNAFDTAYILAKTAKPYEEAKVSPFHPENLTHPDIDFSINFHQNTKGYQHSRNAGFGIFDAQKAVEMAKKYSRNLGVPVQYSQHFNTSPITVRATTPIPDNSGTCASITVNVPNNFLIWSTELSLDITHDAPSELGIYITDPASSQKSQVANYNTRFSGSDFSYNQTFRLNQFFSENASGDWVIQVCDASPLNQGTLNGVQLNFWGYENLSTLQ